MDDLLYVSMTGASQLLAAQTVNANNLANATTTGFRQDLMQFRSMPVFGDGEATRVYAMMERPAVDFSGGPIMSTGRDLDIAVSGEGWIAVQAPDGTEAYTRDGNLKVDANGLLTTARGLPVMGNLGPIAIPDSEKIEIGEDGTITVQPLGQNPATLAIIDRIKLVNAEDAELVKGEDGLIHLREPLEIPADIDVRLIVGSLEGSNVNAVSAMVNMIGMARQYELQVKMMKVAEENDAATSQLMSVS